MKRSSFKRPELPPRQPTVHKPIPQGQAGVIVSAAQHSLAVPKSEPKRNAALLALARGRDCLILSPSVHFHDRATVVACHSNQKQHGKGMGRKADDHYTVWGCIDCHRWLDRGPASAEEKAAVFAKALQRQIWEWEIIAENMLEERKSREAAQWALRLHGIHFK